MSTFRDGFETNGQQLYGFLRGWMADSVPRTQWGQWLEPLALPAGWVEHFEQAVTLATTERVVAAGRSLARTHGEDRQLFRRTTRPAESPSRTRWSRST